MTNLTIVKASIERCTRHMVALDSFHLTRMTRTKALSRVIERLKEEMLDAVYISPERRDELAEEVRTLSTLLKGLPGPVIEKLLLEVILDWLPTRKFD